MTTPFPISKRNKPPEPPDFLGPAGKKLWRTTYNDYDLTNPGSPVLLQIACACEDAMMLMRAEIKKDGMVITSKHGTKRAHPLLPNLRAHQRAQMAAMRDLNPTPKNKENKFHGF